LALSCVCIAGSVTSSAHEGLDHDIERETRALAEDPSDAEARLRRARYYRLDGQPEMALADLQQAARLAPDDARLHFERGFALAALGRNTDAESELSGFISQTGGSAAAHAERARIRALTGRPDLAIADLEVAITLGPSLDLYVDLGRLLEGQTRYAEAADRYREGLARLGDTPLLQRALVAALIVLGRTEEAREARLRALTKANESLGKRPTSARLVARAEVHLALGDTPAARRDLEQALRNSPQMESAKAMLAAITAEEKDRGMEDGR
jgi:tetratricopeptide (TPR) repeat protein